MPVLGAQGHQICCPVVPRSVAGMDTQVATPTAAMVSAAVLSDERLRARQTRNEKADEKLREFKVRALACYRRVSGPAAIAAKTLSLALPRSY